MDESLIGRGWAYPLGVAPGGGVALVGRDSELEQSIYLILGTAYGERPMRPEFGCGIHEYVFDPATHETAQQIAREVRASLLRWEPRIDVTSVRVDFDDAERSTLYLDIEYTAKDESDPRSLVFPFYLIRPEE